MKNNNTLSLYDNSPAKGIYSAKDPFKVQVEGIWESAQKTYVNITFSACNVSHGVDCATKEEIANFLSTNFLTVLTNENFINFEEVFTQESTLQDFSRLALWDKLDKDL